MRFSIRRFILAALSRRDAGVAREDWERLRFSYAQFGEDILAQALLPDTKGFYVEVGAFHPVQFSNTYLFYRKGWHGIAIDPNPRVKKLFHARRPRDLTVECAVGEHEGPVIFDMVSTGETDHVRGAGGDDARKTPHRSIEVPCRRLDSILKEHLPTGQRIDFLSVDCEGSDLSVLRSNDWKKYAPRVIAVEDWEPQAKSQICQFLTAQNYRLVISTKDTRLFEAV